MLTLYTVKVVTFGKILADSVNINRLMTASGDFMLNNLSFRRARLLYSAFAIASLFSSQTVLPGFAQFAQQEDDGSMEDIWSDQSGGPAGNTGEPKKTPAKKVRVPAPTQAEPAAAPENVNQQEPPASRPPVANISPTPGATSGQFPVCKLSDLTASSFVKSGGWPGIGPFEPDDMKKGEFADRSNNRMKANLAGDNVTQLQLSVASEKNQFLSLEMTTDFLLEALGENPSKIARFNRALEEKQTDLQVNRLPVKLNAGRLDVSIQNVAQDQSDSSFVILVEGNSPLSANIPGVPRQIAATQGTQPSTSLTDQNRFTVRQPQTGSTPVTAPPRQPQPGSTPATAPPRQPQPGSTSVSTPAQIAQQPQITQPTPVETNPPAQPDTDQEMLKQFVNLVQNWQDVKRVVVKSRKGDNLGKVLGGNALATQNQAIKWLLDHQKLYDMVPLGLEVTGYETVVPDKKYTVNVHIREQSRILDSNTMSILKDEMKDYKVAYTVEKFPGGWLIVDSKVVNN